MKLPSFSITQALAKSNLIAQKNYYQFELLQNSRSQMNLLNSNFDLATAASAENSLQMASLNASTQLMTINAQLDAMNQKSINYLA